MNSFINGAIAMACVAIGVFFIKFWRDSYDRLFAMFAVSFWLLAIDRIVVGWIGQSDTGTPAEYLPRLASFVVIIAAIIEKNRKRQG